MQYFAQFHIFSQNTVGLQKNNDLRIHHKGEGDFGDTYGVKKG